MSNKIEEHDNICIEYIRTRENVHPLNPTPIHPHCENVYARLGATLRVCCVRICPVHSQQLTWKINSVWLFLSLPCLRKKQTAGRIPQRTHMTVYRRTEPYIVLSVGRRPSPEPHVCTNTVVWPFFPISFVSYFFRINFRVKSRKVIVYEVETYSVYS